MYYKEIYNLIYTFVVLQVHNAVYTTNVYGSLMVNNLEEVHVRIIIFINSVLASIS